MFSVLSIAAPVDGTDASGGSLFGKMKLEGLFLNHR
jgi:hypothetical protein